MNGSGAAAAGQSSGASLEDGGFDAEIFVEGSCPAPVLRSAKALRGLSSGQVLKVACLDPVSVKDLAAFASQTGNRLIKQAQAEDGGRTLYLHWIARR